MSYSFFIAESVLQLAIDAKDTKRQLWLKLEYGKPALDRWRGPSFFASPKKGEKKGKPKGKPSFKPGDLVLLCANETRDCYAILEVTKEAECQPTGYKDYPKSFDDHAYERWPWINRAKPRLVSDEPGGLKLNELDINTRGLQNGHVRFKSDKSDQFVKCILALAQLTRK